MLTISNSNGFYNLKNYKDIKSNTNSTQSTNSSQNSNKILGYEVDKDGYFTEEFNKAAGIPNDYKIHSSTMQSLVRSQTSSGVFNSFSSIDIAKTIRNAYDIVSQLLDKSPELAGKESFSQTDLANCFPQSYEINSAGQITRVFSFDEMSDLVASGNFKATNGGQLFSSFYNVSKNSENDKPAPTPFNPDILHSNITKGRETSYSFDTTSDKYTNADGSITKGGLLIGFLSNNAGTFTTQKPLIEGETTIWGKIQGLNGTSQAQISSLKSALNFSIPLNGWGDYIGLMNAGSIDEFSAKFSAFMSKFSVAKNDNDDMFAFIEKQLQENAKMLETLFGKKTSKINIKA